MIWKSLLEIRSKLSLLEEDIDFISVTIGDEIIVSFDHNVKSTFSIDLRKDKRNNSFPNSNSFTLNLSQKQISSEEMKMLNLYLPYALLPYFSRKNKKCYTISHFAQTLDGRIASFSGDSKWIGNEENLIHAHRMRALCDAILIGSKTLNADDPKLNVRLVDGVNPIKIVIGGDSLDIDNYQAIDSSTILFCKNHRNYSTLDAERVVLDKAPLFDSQEILNVLCKKGIHSVYIEGGAFTTSNFLKDGLIDQVQIHISPQILGSGTHSFSFDGILNMEKSIKFKEPTFIPLGNDVMFIGNKES